MQKAKRQSDFSTKVGLSTSATTERAPTLREVQAAMTSEFRSAGLTSNFTKFDFINENRFKRDFRLNEYKRQANNKYLDLLYMAYGFTLSFFSDRRADQVLNDYARHHPSASYSAEDSIDKFADFLSATPEYKRFPFLAELAELEFKIFTAQYASPQKIEAAARSHVHAHLSTAVVHWNLILAGQLLHKLNVGHAKRCRQFIAITFDNHKVRFQKLTLNEAAFFAQNHGLTSFGQNLRSSEPSLVYAACDKEKATRTLMAKGLIKSRL